jgi:hypothetical protein
MAEISKPDYTCLWSSGGSIVAPSNVKIQTGWTAEVPPFQWENWSQNRQDTAIAHILQHGISVWDDTTEYQALKSYVQDSVGNIDRAKVTNTGQNPATDAAQTYWSSAFAPPTASRRNVLINASGKIKVRPYVSGAATTVSNQYTLDRWYVNTSGQNVSWVDSAGVRTITTPAGGITQAIRAENIAGGVYVLSYTGTASATINGTAVANGGTITLPANTIARVRFSGGTLVNPQLERGTYPTLFDTPNTEAEELICQKYYYRVNLTWLIQGFTDSGGQRIPDAFLAYPKMITDPTPSFSNGGGVNVLVGTMSSIAGGLTQTAASVAAGYSSYSLTVTALDAEFT